MTPPRSSARLHRWLIEMGWCRNLLNGAQGAAAASNGAAEATSNSIGDIDVGVMVLCQPRHIDIPVQILYLRCATKTVHGCFGLTKIWK